MRPVLAVLFPSLAAPPIKYLMFFILVFAPVLQLLQIVPPTFKGASMVRFYLLQLLHQLDGCTFCSGSTSFKTYCH